MFEVIAAGGWLMLPIILCSIAVVAISAERYWSLNPNKIAPRHLLAQVWGWIKNNELNAERLKELKQSSQLGEILSAGLSNSRYGREIMKDSIEEAANKVIHELERFIGILGTIAAVTPLLGLLGTVLGMIEVFNAIMLQGTGNAGVLAGGISQALITTAAGLCVAIPAMIFHRYFQRHIDSLVVTMEEEAIKLVDALHSDRRVDVKTKS
ncbi:MotA/TolQ/ExbB proton channel family protein [Gilvimarinus agarilyticus]|uniref:MotA/TolQ/ExbB proton channel family protein n=1 Tax=unclassified Gilvimarinus TaxID=2642066 RepID=UPI001C091A64|nr:MULTISPECIES: MotA/TolQ/ExbB proton channel family protein [unclassified Gilvimarinus]MBU2887426.1 MotA/TolQ/ExbB proton channel family protein [Gilvimarinus agarilyticus]MDO6572085.1 MotA/TolQ/ExbB proton channel family protein [Gilvimarinus sp. 2_MG-2023]MDO6746146.1 MotA/TolQ/ExbB proton channel family protein [Gilvimarinus sp. 1_MG-2023]